MARVRDAFCSYCGTKFAEPLVYPRTCAACGVQIWANPIPVAVALAPVEVDGGGVSPAGSAAERRGGSIAGRIGLLVIRRAIPPGIGKLALVGGFVEAHESWQHGMARELLEETSVAIAAPQFAPLWFASSEPKPDRVLLFGVAPPVRELPTFEPDDEVSERGLVFGPDGLDEVFAFSLHAEAARRFFAARQITGAHAFVAR